MKNLRNCLINKVCALFLMVSFCVVASGQISNNPPPSSPAPNTKPDAPNTSSPSRTNREPLPPPPPPPPPPARRPPVKEPTVDELVDAFFAEVKLVFELISQETAESKKQALLRLDELQKVLNNLKVKKFEAELLGYSGAIYHELGETGKSSMAYHKALSIYREIADKKGEAKTLLRIGSLFRSLGNKQKSFECSELALPLLLEVLDADRKRGDESEIANTLFTIGSIYSRLGKEKEALEFCQEALVLYKKLGDKNAEAEVLTAIGHLHFNSKKLVEAIEYFSRAMTLFNETNNKRGRSELLQYIVFLGFVADYAGKKEKIDTESYKDLLKTFRRIGYNEGTAEALGFVGGIVGMFGNRRESLFFYNEALQIYQSLGNKREEAQHLAILMNIWNELKAPDVSIFYGKQSVNKYQELRLAVSELDKETQKKYLETVQDTYRKLAEILIEDGRFAQAEQVLRMLKEEEYSNFVRRDANEIQTLNERVKLEPAEEEVIKKYKLLADKLGEKGRRFHELELKSKQFSEKGLIFAEAAPKENEELVRLGEELETARDAFQIFLDKELEAEIKKDRKQKVVAQKAAFNMRVFGRGTATLYTVVGEDRYRVILTTPEIQVDGKYEIKAGELNKKVFAFRAALLDRNADPGPAGKELYDIMIKPVERELRASGVNTLLWYLDGVLRYVPLAALSPDGKRYLIEDFQNVVLTSTTSDLQSRISGRNWRVLGLGVSAAGMVDDPTDPAAKISFSALPGTKRELLSIVSDETVGEKGIYAGKRFLDDKFTIENFHESLKPERFNVVHLASHFYLGNNDASSFLLLGNNRILPLSKIKGSSFIKFGGVDLVTLSACNTAFADTSDGSEVDSLADIIQTQGGRSVLATLWPVADESTSLIMSEFYRLRKKYPNLTKAGAIQLAQKAMIDGRLRLLSTDGKDNNAGTTKGAKVYSASGGGAPPFPYDKRKPFAHPYFWSPFVLIGNWK